MICDLTRWLTNAVVTVIDPGRFLAIGHAGRQGGRVSFDPTELADRRQPGPRDGPFFLAADITVLDEGIAGRLTGGKDQDWFFLDRAAATKRTLTDPAIGEILEII